MNVLSQVLSLIVENLLRVWPLLVISIPFAVILRTVGISERVAGAFHRRPVEGILLATVAGAFGPFCSCSVVPVIASMLVGGVPLPAVMAFWVASPTMDPEIFFMSVAFLGLDLAVGRLAATLLVSLGAGFFTWLAVERGWIGSRFLRNTLEKSAPTGLKESACGCGREEAPRSGLGRILRETGAVTAWVTQFMILGFAIQALVVLFVPQEVVVRWIGADNPLSPVLSALLGIPLYTGNLAAVPLVGGLLGQGMGGGAALSFLVAGPVTTLPAMAAVWGVVRPRVFLVYLSWGFFGAVASGYAFELAAWLMGGS